jgi:hypothetical protein
LANQDEEPHAPPPDRPREPAPERSFWSTLPRRNFRRAIFLIAALLAIIAIKRMGGGFSLAKLFNDVAPPPTPQKQQHPFQHLEVKPK